MKSPARIQRNQIGQPIRPLPPSYCNSDPEVSKDIPALSMALICLGLAVGFLLAFAWRQ